ncbi:hypothetical protein C8Z91_33050 [Paenibacillus elgii]|uniref:Uncharacterized protein n=1 Tax=Paenibacillus elgii TaxID=189691 RepID=A0A2T6FS19_9BACL|nr:hypothetical protein [Paenibacillus elgii]PUA34709.1 hypothetical protein C8Z91_33050 [Paenibacillus elgii]
MSYVCPGNAGYPSKPNYDTFWNDYLYYANIIVPVLGVSRSFILGVWYQEWGIPINNPGFSKGTEGYTPQGYCGSFPVFQTLEDGANAFAALFSRRYNGQSTATKTIFQQTTNVSDAYYNGFPGGLKAYNVKNDDGAIVSSVISQAFAGSTQSGGSILTGTYAANEMFGASPWNEGHYMRNGDSYPGQRLNAVLNSSGWADKERVLG